MGAESLVAEINDNVALVEKYTVAQQAAAVLAEVPSPGLDSNSDAPIIRAVERGSAALLPLGSNRPPPSASGSVPTYPSAPPPMSSRSNSSAALSVASQPVSERVQSNV